MIRLPTDAYPRALPLLRGAEIRSHLALAHAGRLAKFGA